MKKITLILFITVIAFSSMTQAQTVWTQMGNHIVGDTTMIYSSALDINGDGSIVAIGAAEDFNYSIPGDIASGSVKIFEYDGANWNLLGNKFNGSAYMQKSGRAVSLNYEGNIVAISSLDSIHIYEYSAGSWSELGNTILSLDIGSLDEFGSSISLDSVGHILIVGAKHSNNGSIQDVGETRVFEFNGSTWNQKGSIIEGGGEEASLGTSVDISSDGNIIAMGASGRRTPPSSGIEGYACVYEYNTTASDWVQLGGDIPSGLTSCSYFGMSVSLSKNGKVVAIGAPNVMTGMSSGIIKVYEYNGSTWIQKGNNIIDPLFQNTGYTVSTNNDGSMVAIGSSDSSPTGLAILYEYNNSTSEWQKKGNSLVGGSNEGFGSSVALSSENIILACNASRYNGFYHGRVKVYDLCGTSSNLVMSSCTSVTSPSGNYTWTSSGVYQDTIPNSYGCDSVITINVIISEPYQQQEICLVTVDTATSKNKVIWEGVSNVGTADYIVYKETASNVYTALDTISADSSLFYIDYASDPSAHSDKYKITVIDTCNNESDIDSCAFHKTMNLTLSNVGTTMSLNWEKYEVEDNSFIPPMYYIYRGTTPNNLSLLGSVTGSSNSYNDNGVTIQYYYMIAVERTCGAKALYNIYSNKKDNAGLIGINEQSGNIPLSVYPNPTSGEFTIECEGMESLEIVDIAGKVIYEVVALSNKAVNIDISAFSKGVYFVRVMTENGVAVERIVLE